MSKAKLVCYVSWLCLLLPMEGKASELDRYSLQDGSTLSGWAVAADGENVLFKQQDGSYCYHAFSEVADSTKSKIEDLRKERDIVHISQHVESSDSPPDRFLIPTCNVVRYEQEWGSVANAAINFMLWWDKIGVCQIAEEGTEADKAEWLQDTLYRYVKAYEEAGSTVSNLVRCLKEYFNDYPSQNYTFEYEVLSFGDHPDAFVERAQGLSMSLVTVSRVASGQFKSRHSVSLIEATANNGILLNVWGKIYMGQLFKPSGLFNGSTYTKDMIWDVDIISTCPDDFDKGGDRWIIHGSDQLLVVRPVRRPDAEPKLIEVNENSGHSSPSTALSGAAAFGRDQAVEYEVKSNALTYGKAAHGYRVFLDDEEISDFIYAHAPSRVRYNIPEGASLFTAWGVSVRPRGKYRTHFAGHWRYVVVIDGREVFRSNPLSEYQNYSFPISVSIPTAAKEIDLIVEALDDSFGHFSVWAQPRFE